MTVALAAGAAIKAALVQQAAAMGVRIELPVEQTKAWSSCSFRGGRHSFLMVSHDSDGAMAWLRVLEEHHPVVPGFLLSDLTVAWANKSGETAIASIDVLSVAQ